MKAKAVRLHGAGDLRLDEFELPEITDDEILVKVISDSVCMSTYKCAILGENTRLYDGGIGTAQHTCRRLEAAGLLRDGEGEVIIEESDPEKEALCRALLEAEL